MNEPRPRITSARPFEAALRVEKRWNTPDRVVGGEHGDGGAEADAPGAPGDRREHDFRRRHREIGPVVLADTEGVDAERVGVARPPRSRCG